MIELQSIHKTFHHDKQIVHALRDINLHVAKGEIYGVVGQSGAGKSTLIRCVNLLERPDSGAIIVAGQDLTQLPDAELFRALVDRARGNADACGQLAGWRAAVLGAHQRIVGGCPGVAGA